MGSRVYEAILQLVHEINDLESSSHHSLRSDRQFDCSQGAAPRSARDAIQACEESCE